MGSHNLPSDLLAPGVVIITGPFGSGKTEIAINLALQWAATVPTYLADLDVITPYFRPRDIANCLAAHGVSVLAPSGAHGALDAPVLPREIAALLTERSSGMVIDVGGQPEGAGILLHWREALVARAAKMLLVANPRRPGVGEVGELAALARAIGERAGLAPYGIVANGNLGPSTTAQHVAEGLQQARELGARLGLPVVLACCPAELADDCVAVTGEVPLLGLSFYLRPSWQRAIS